MAKKSEAQLELENVEITLTQGSVKTAMKDAGASSRDLWYVARDEIRVIPNFNIRLRNDALRAHIRSIADSMKLEGFYRDKPLAGYVAKEGDAQVIYVTDGHCRLEARDLAVSEGAEIDALPVVIAAQGTSIEDLTVALVRTGTGKPPEPYEVAIACKRLSRFGWDPAHIALRLGFTRTYVDNLLLLMGAHPDIRQMVMDDRVSATTAVEAIKTHGAKALERLQAALENAKAGGKERVTKKDLPAKPEVIFKKQVTKAAPMLFNAVRDITLDEGYQQLSQALREKLNALMAELNTFEAGSSTQAQTAPQL